MAASSGGPPAAPLPRAPAYGCQARPPSLQRQACAEVVVVVLKILIMSSKVPERNPDNLIVREEPGDEMLSR
jgi:hypothetical protein